MVGFLLNGGRAMALLLQLCAAGLHFKTHSADGNAYAMLIFGEAGFSSRRAAPVLRQ